MVALGPASIGLAQWARRHVGPCGLAWRTLMTRAHVSLIGKENFVSSKTRILNQLNKKIAALGAKVGGQFKQMYKIHQSWPPPKKNYMSTFFPKISCLHLKAWYWFWADCHRGEHLDISQIATQMCLHYITAQYGSQYSIILSIRCSGTIFSASRLLEVIGTFEKIRQHLVIEIPYIFV